MSVRTTVYDPVAAAAAEQAAAAAAALEDAGGAGGEDESKGRERAVATFVRCRVVWLILSHFISRSIVTKLQALCPTRMISRC